MYYDMQSICRDDCGSVIHVFANHLQAQTDKVGVPDKIAGNWELDGFKILERWWMNS